MLLLSNFVELFVISAPWLLLGLVLAGLMKVFIPADFMSRHLGKEGFVTTVKAALFGAPLPLCSCGVIPAALGLRRSGASKSATTAFLVSTPETGVDSVSISYVLLGPFMAVVRPIAAVVSGVVAGLLVGRDDDDISTKKHEHSSAESSCCSSKPAPKVEAASCCSSESKKVEPEPAASCCSTENTSTSVASQPASDTANKAESSCCSSESHDAPANESIFDKISHAMNYAATDLVRDTTVWLLIGLFFAALIQTYVPADFLATYGQGVLAMVVMVLISIPMYICATASTPIAAGLLLSGVAPGAVLVFMMAGPATNIATLGVVGRELGKRAIAAYLIGVIGTAVVFGLAVDWAVAEFGFVVAPQVGEEHDMLPSVIAHGLAVFLAVLMALSLKDIVEKYVKHKPHAHA